MPVNSYNVGRDLTFTLVTAQGTLTLSGITEYDIKPQFSDLKHKGLDGKVTHGIIPDGWQITFKVERNDSSVDDFFAFAEAAYFNGQNVQPGTLVESIAEVSGAVSQYRYDNVVLKYDDAGSWKGDALVPVSLTAMASTRTKVA